MAVTRSDLLVLAAGAGSRMQSDIPKPLVSYEDKLLVRRVVEAFPFARKTTIIAREGDQRAWRHVDIQGVNVAFQPKSERYSMGPLTSLLFGLDTVAPDATGLWVAWCDMVNLDAHMLEGLDEWMNQIDLASCVEAKPRLFIPCALRRNSYVSLKMSEDRGVDVHALSRPPKSMPVVRMSDCGVFGFRLSGRDAFTLHELKSALTTLLDQRGGLDAEPLPWLTSLPGVWWVPVHSSNADTVNVPGDLR